MKMRKIKSTNISKMFLVLFNSQKALSKFHICNFTEKGGNLERLNKSLNCCILKSENETKANAKIKQSQPFLQAEIHLLCACPP